MPAASTDVEDISDDDVDTCSWQTTTNLNKRNVCKSPIGNDPKRRHVASDDGPSTSRSNRYSTLQTEEDDNNQQQSSGANAADSIKPPPLFIPGVNDINKMIENIRHVIPKEDFNYKSLGNGEVKLLVCKVEPYRKLMRYLEDKKISFHTYQIRQERSYRVVFKGIHHSTPTADIKAHLLSLGFDVRNVHNVRSSITKQPLSMFFVDLDPKPDNKEIYKIRTIENAIVTVEPPRKVNDFVQCFRCQEYGHTQGYCKKPHRCVKCAHDHPTAECKMDKNTPPRCVHCMQSHTANYKGCKVYQSLTKKQLPRNITATPRTPLNTQQNVQSFNQTSPNMTYSDVLRGQGSANPNGIFEKLEVMLNKQLELTTNLLSMMTLILNKLCN